jgi:hypothetical protein
MRKRMSGSSSVGGAAHGFDADLHYALRSGATVLDPLAAPATRRAAGVRAGRHRASRRPGRSQIKGVYHINAVDEVTQITSRSKL